jgi:hypothetical protein
VTTNLGASWYYVVGVHFPRRMSDAYAFEELAAAMISESGTFPSRGRISRRNSSGS